MAATLRKPAPGQRVICPGPYAGDDEQRGTVIDLLGVQFTYATKTAADRGAVRFCFYADAWRIDNDAATQRKARHDNPETMTNGELF